MSSLRIVVVNYRSASLALECLRSLAAELAPLARADVVVVDNASGDGSVEPLAGAVRRQRRPGGGARRPAQRNRTWWWSTTPRATARSSGSLRRSDASAGRAGLRCVRSIATAASPLATT